MHLRSVAFHPDLYPTRRHYPFSLDIFHRTDRILFDTPVTLFVGENGTGKSTLLEAIAHKADIHIWHNDDKARFEVNPYEGKLHRCISLEWTGGRVPGSFFGSSVFQDFARTLDAWAAADPGQLAYFGGKSLLTQSHGQSIMSFFRARYGIKGLYLMDEPETALSPRTQIELLQLLTQIAQAGHAQFIIATHSPILVYWSVDSLWSLAVAGDVRAGGWVATHPPAAATRSSHPRAWSPCVAESVVALFRKARTVAWDSLSDEPVFARKGY